MATVEIQSHAIDNLRYIRETMERATSFTAVPGRGGIIMGVTALAAAVIAARQESTVAWLGVWIAEAAVALAVGLVAVWRKAHVSSLPLLSAPARKFALAFAPPIILGGILTVALARAGIMQFLPGLWLAHYGVAVIGAGAFSVRVVPAMGLGFVLAGTIALFAPAQFGDLILGAAFGGLHIVFGFIIARRYGG